MKQSLILGSLAAVNILLGLLLQWYVITRLGVGIETDALVAAMALPQLILAILGGSLTQVLVPLLATADEKSLRQDTWAFFLFISGLFTLLSLLLYVTANCWIPLLVPGFSVEARRLTVTLTRIQMLSLVFTAATSVLWSAYGARQKFIWAEVSALLSNLAGLLLLIWLLPLYGILAGGWVIAVRTGLQMACLLPGLGRWQGWRGRSAATLEAWQRMKPILLGTSYYKTDPLFDRFLVSMAQAGTLSLLYIAQQIYAAANQVINKAVAAPLVPLLAIQAKAGRWHSFRQVYRKRLLSICGLTIFAYLILIFFGLYLLRLLIGHGGVTEGNVRLLWWIMLALWGVLIAGSLGQVTAAAFYAMGDTRTPTRLGILTYTVYIPAKILCFIYYGLTGLAISISLFVAVNFLLQLLLLENSLRLSDNRNHERA